MLKLLKKYAGEITILSLFGTCCIVTAGIIVMPLSSLVFTGVVATGVIAVAGGSVLYWVKKDEKHDSVEKQANSDELNQSDRLIFEMEPQSVITSTNSSAKSSEGSQDELDLKLAIKRLTEENRTLTESYVEINERLNHLDQKFQVNELANKRTVDEMQKNTNARFNSLESGLSSSSSRNSFYDAANNRANDDNFDQDEDQKQAKKL